MYADSTMRRFRPVSFGAALALNTAIIGALIFAVPSVLKIAPDKPIGTIEVFTPEPPPPIDVKPEQTKHQEVRPTLPYTPDPIVDIRQPEVSLTGTNVLPLDPPPVDLGTPKGTGDIKIEVPPPPPLPFLAATIDPRFAGAFQPEYPASELRAQREGKVTVRVRIGVDGRVTAVEQLRATSPAFFEATRRQALSRWRFKPATRGGKPEESWMTKNVTFVITGEE